MIVLIKNKTKWRAKKENYSSMPTTTAVIAVVEVIGIKSCLLQKKKGISSSGAKECDGVDWISDG